MLHTCVRKLDLTGTVQTNLGTKRCLTYVYYRLWRTTILLAQKFQCMLHGEGTTNTWLNLNTPHPRALTKKTWLNLKHW